MNIKVMRSIHLYLGVFFAPLLMFFIISGCWQMFHLHEAQKSGYQPPKVVESLSQVHIHQKWSEHSSEKPSQKFRYLALAMSLGIIVTTLLGIVMAFKYTKTWVVWLCLLIGLAIPIVLIWLVHKGS